MSEATPQSMREVWGTTWNARHVSLTELHNLTDKRECVCMCVKEGYSQWTVTAF